MKNFFKSLIFFIILVLSFFYYEEKIFKRYDVLVDYAYYKIPKEVPIHIVVLILDFLIII